MKVVIKLGRPYNDLWLGEQELDKLAAEARVEGTDLSQHLIQEFTSPPLDEDDDQSSYDAIESLDDEEFTEYQSTGKLPWEPDCSTFKRPEDIEAQKYIQTIGDSL